MRSSGNSMNLNSVVINRHISMLNFARVLPSEDSAEATALSTLPLLIPE